MSNKESPSLAETPLSPKPQKPILLINAVQAPDTVDPGDPSRDDEVPMADDSDVFELSEDVFELTKEVNVEDQPNATIIGIASPSEMRGKLDKPNGHAQTKVLSVPTVPVLGQNNSDAIMKMIREVTEPQPVRPAVLKWTITPTETPRIEKSAHEMLKDGRDKLDKEIFKIGGKVRDELSLKIIEGDLLAIVEISKETVALKDISDVFLQLTSPNNLLQAEQPMGCNNDPKIEDADSPLVFARNFRDGIYLVLKSTITDREALNESELEVYKYLGMEPTEKQKTEKSLLSILGGKHAEKLKPEIVEEFYRKIEKADDFFTLSKKIEERGERKKVEEQKGESPDKTGTDQ